MPVLSVFYGIIVRMYKENDGKHKLPHIHAEYSGKEVVLDFDGNVIEGDIPANKLKILSAWVEIHREDLEVNWKLISSGDKVFRIEPLK